MVRGEPGEPASHGRGLRSRQISSDVSPSWIAYFVSRAMLSMLSLPMMRRRWASTVLGLMGRPFDGLNAITCHLGNDRAQLAVEVFCYRVKEYIGAYAAVLGELHALIFSGGIGEHAPHLRRQMCENLERLGIAIDPAKNNTVPDVEADTATDKSPVRVFAIPANEELAIANDVYEWLPI